jgi:adenylate kinase
METQTFVFFGQGGSGKGTQVRLLINYMRSNDNKETIYGGTGEEFRKILATDNFTAGLIKDSVDKGELQPDFLTTSLFVNILISSLDGRKHLVVDGYPRTVGQAENFINMMEFYKRDKVKIIYIELGEAEAMKRNLLRGRADDTEDGLKKRFAEYATKVIPAMNYLKEKANYDILTINGEQPIEKVQKDIIKALGF